MLSGRLCWLFVSIDRTLNFAHRLISYALTRDDKVKTDNSRLDYLPAYLYVVRARSRCEDGIRFVQSHRDSQRIKCKAVNCWRHLDVGLRQRVELLFDTCRCHKSRTPASTAMACTRNRFIDYNAILTPLPLYSTKPHFGPKNEKTRRFVFLTTSQYCVKSCTKFQTRCSVSAMSCKCMHILHEALWLSCHRDCISAPNDLLLDLEHLINRHLHYISSTYIGRSSYRLRTSAVTSFIIVTRSVYSGSHSVVAEQTRNQNPIFLR